MKDKLYNTDYLEHSAKLFQTLKERSYTPFLTLQNGIIADIGCGTGIDVFNLARLSDKSLKITGIDYDPKMIEKAAASRHSPEKVAFRIADATDLPFEDGSLSGIRNERLIQHLKQPEKAFREFYRTLKPGHPIVIVETDWSSMAFYNGTPEITPKIKAYFTSHNVANGSAAANLSFYLKNNHFREINLHVFPLVSTSLEQVIAFTRLDHVLRQMESDRNISSEEHATFLKSLQKADAEHNFACAINLMIASAIK